MAIEILKRDLWVPDHLSYKPRTDFGKFVLNCARELPSDLAAELIERISKIVVFQSELRAVIFRGRDSFFWSGSPVEDYGVVSSKLVTDAGVAFMVDAFQALATISNMKYHGFGSATTAESAGQTALTTEFTTQYATNNTRPTGSQTEQAANIYKTIATFAPDADVTVEEHGIFDQAANSGGTLLDRSLTGTKSLTGSTDTLQVDYRFTITSGG